MARRKTGEFKAKDSAGNECIVHIWTDEIWDKKTLTTVKLTSDDPMAP